MADDYEYSSDYETEEEKCEDEIIEEEKKVFEEYVKRLWETVIKEYLDKEKNTVINPDMSYEEFYHFMISRKSYKGIEKN
jgi:hypothetical protein